VQSELGRPGTAACAASKGAVKMLTKGMALDLGPFGIMVNGPGPGYFKTELTTALVNDEAVSAWLIGRTPSRHWGDVEELAPAVVFLASDAGRFVNGHILCVDGGVTATLQACTPSRKSSCSPTPTGARGSAKRPSRWARARLRPACRR
jgi:gluconate 5-dehydrogenase